MLKSRRVAVDRLLTMAALGEFDLIKRCFVRALGSRDADGYARHEQDAAGVVLGPGDDGAVLAPRPDHQLVVSADTSNVGVHFPADAPADAIGHRALAVNLSDLAAMGAVPRWYTLALTLPDADAEWLDDFASGLHRLADRHGITLVGGDVTRGPLSISITVMGEVPAGELISRHGARPGDVLAVTGPIGGAHGGLELWQQGQRDMGHPLIAAYLLPEPRVAAGQCLRGLVSAGLDISDGLWADLGHLCLASGVGAQLMPSVPVAPDLATATESARDAAVWHGGDDYELLLAIAPGQWDVANEAMSSIGGKLYPIGECTSTAGIHGGPSSAGGWQHFAGDAS
ncbi:thiamine-phosphate kinase [Larsenimonas rhizosphaerae]|uniref:thiamine-phosphate kinase n=1 Tax=Larsenimonas rhizosphaerae TaxID=2944682 RepID=UPI002033C26A|nr:thiamine-phosphate kinase [Larsenimonas rhizosphaerae]